MQGVVVKIAAGAIIPSIATIVFNLLSFMVDNFRKNPLPEIGASIFDIGAGCAFSLVGICVTVKDHQLSSKLLVAFVLLLLFLIAGDILVPTLLDWNRWLMLVMVDAVSFATLSWAITEAE